MSQLVKGRGRGRARNHPPSITDSIAFSSSLIAIITSSTLPSENSSTIDNSRSDSGFSSTSPSIKYPTPSPTSIYASRGRGRGCRTSLREKAVPADPHWTVTNLTDAQFHSNKRPKKPDELGILGEQIQVIANYFPILQFPHRGLVYKYQIQIRNRKNLEIHRERRR